MTDHDFETEQKMPMTQPAYPPTKTDQVYDHSDGIFQDLETM